MGIQIEENGLTLEEIREIQEDYWEKTARFARERREDKIIAGFLIFVLVTAGVSFAAIIAILIAIISGTPG